MIPLCRKVPVLVPFMVPVLGSHKTGYMNVPLACVPACLPVEIGACLDCPSFFRELSRPGGQAVAQQRSLARFAATEATRRCQL